MSDTSIYFYLLISAFAVSQILLALVKILTGKDTGTAEYLFSLFLFCIGIYLTKPLFAYGGILYEGFVPHPAAQLFWRHLPTAVPSLFLLCSASIFLDEFRFKAEYLLAPILTVFPPLIFELFFDGSSLLELLLVTAPQGLEFVLLLAGLGIIGFSWKADLVQSRRQFRVIVMGFSGSLILTVIAAQQLSELPQFTVDLIHFPIAAVFLLVLNIFLLKLDVETFMFHKPLVDDMAEDAETIENPLLPRIRQSMEDSQDYRNEKLTITTFAYQMDIPEYKLRQVINQELGYRNFNEFLNHYRIEEASALLRESEFSVTEIANKVGFNSLSAFNRAFRQIHQKTPTEFRKSGNF